MIKKRHGRCAMVLWNECNDLSRQSGLTSHLDSIQNMIYDYFGCLLRVVLIYVFLSRNQMLILYKESGPLHFSNIMIVDSGADQHCI